MGKEIKKCLIITGVPEDDIYYYKNYIDGRFIIGADSGYQKCVKLNIKPNLIIGDFDSSTKPDTDIETIVLPVRKDDTDTLSAVKEAIKRGYNDIIILGGIGNRFDHTYNNVLVLNFCFDRNIKAVLINKHNKIEIIEKSYSFKKDNYPYFSMYPLFDACIGLTTRGTQYDLTDFTIPADCLYTQSNSFKDDVVTINYKSGKLLLILSND